MVTQHRAYVYALIDPRSNLPFYIGKGTGSRAKTHLRSGHANSHNPKQQKINKIRKLGLEPRIEYIKEQLTEQEAFDLEIALIEEYKRKEDGGILTNLTLGGEGVSKGFKPWNTGKKGCFSEESIKKMSDARSGKKNHMYGKHHSKETIEKIKQTQIKNDSFKGREPVNKRPVICLDTKEIFESATAAARNKGLDHANIGSACIGKLKTTGKLRWAYLD